MARRAVWAVLAATLLLVTACDDASTDDGGNGGSGGEGAGGNGAGGNGAGGDGGLTCIDREGEGVLGSCFYTDMGFCAAWFGADNSDLAAWQSACEGQPGVWTSGAACAKTDTLGTCKSTSEALTVINEYYPGGMVTDTAMVESMCQDTAVSCQDFTAP